MENVQEDFLASEWVNTPDYRKEDPPIGQRVVVYWHFPSELYSQDLTLALTVRFWDNTQIEERYHLGRSFGEKSFFFSNKTKEKKKSILTYRLQAISKEGKIVETWKHQFWTELIDIDTDEELHL